MRSFILPVVAFAYSVLARSDYSSVSETNSYREKQYLNDDDFVNVRLDKNSKYDRNHDREEMNKDYYEINHERTVPSSRFHDHENDTRSNRGENHTIPYILYDGE